MTRFIGVWPSVSEVADELRKINANVEEPATVRLYVVGRSFLLHLGDRPRRVSEDAHDPVGLGSIPGASTTFDAWGLANSLVGQAKRGRL